MATMVPQVRPQVDYTQFDTAAIKSQLSSRGLSTDGTRQQLVIRLKEEVDKAWDVYNQSNSSHLPLFPNNKKFNSKKAKKSPEQIEQENAALAVKRQEKLKRRLEHEKRVEEARERKRLKKEEKAKKQQEQILRQKKEKEQRQMCETFLGFDVRNFEQQVRKKLDPANTKIASCSYDTVAKRFKVKFNNAADAANLTKGITMKKPRKLTFSSAVSILPSPVESRCVMFLYPMCNNHPDIAKAKAWCETNGLTQKKDSEVLQAWIQSALKTFSSYGTVVNIYRERGFLVVNFTAASEATKMLANAKTFNDCSFVRLQVGTPTKLDKRTVDKELGEVKAAKPGTDQPST